MRKIPEVAKRLNMSEPSAWRLVYSGRLPYVQIGRSVRVRDEDIEAFIQANVHRHAPEARG